jgi:hypothetical protein
MVFYLSSTMEMDASGVNDLNVKGERNAGSAARAEKGKIDLIHRAGARSDARIVSKGGTDRVMLGAVGWRVPVQSLSGPFHVSLGDRR